MANIEVNSSIRATRTSDFMLDYMWSDPTCEYEPTPRDLAREKFVHEIEKKIPHRIISTHDYLFYLSHQVDTDTLKKQPTPHKALFQFIGTNYGITEPTTRVVPTKDLATAFEYGLHLLDNHKVIWIGTGAIDDYSDPRGQQNLNPPLYKNIRTREDLLDTLQYANAFEFTHPGSYLKIFPQDGERPAIGSMVISNNKNERNLIHVKIRKGEYTTSERKAGDDRPISVSIDLSGPIIKVYTNQSTKETNYWLQIILNSQELFQKLDKSDLKGSDYINPEFLIFLNGLDTKIAFFTDCIWGSKIESQKDIRCPKIDPLTSKLALGLTNEKVLFVPEKHSQALLQYSDYQLAILSTLKSARSPKPDIQSAHFILKTQELLGKLKLPFEIPKLDQITLNSLWRISRGYPLGTTINIIEYLHNQLSIKELTDPNIDYNQPVAKFDRYIRRKIPYTIYKSLRNTFLIWRERLSIPSDKKLHTTVKRYAISRAVAIKLAKYMYRANYLD